MLYKIKPMETIQSAAKNFGYTDFKEFFKAMRYVKGNTFQTGNVIEAPSIPPSNRDRAYDGQAHTNQGTRGMEFIDRLTMRDVAEFIDRLTMRDVADCINRAFALSTGEDNPEAYAQASNGELVDLYKLDLSNMDPGAMIQNVMCEIERVMDIFPNLPPEYKR